MKGIEGISAVMPEAAAFLISWMLSRLLAGIGPSSWLAVPDVPNERSLHRSPVPRTGGIAILGAVLPLVIWIAARSGYGLPLLLLVLAALVVAAVSFWDDRSGAGVGIRFATHVIAAALVVAAGFRLPETPWPPAVPFWARALVSGAVVVWGVNLYNFMDGMDGFAGGMAAIGFATLAWFGARAGYPPFFAVNAVIAMAALGFLAFNFPPARLFMGDVGSAPLGLLMVTMSFWGARAGCFPIWVPLVVFSPFAVDASVTLVRRLLRREQVWQAHRTHHYQRLVRLGWGHRRTVLWEYALMVLSSLVAGVGAMQPQPVQWVILGLWIIGYTILAVMVSRLERRHEPR